MPCPTTIPYLRFLFFCRQQTRRNRSGTAFDFCEKIRYHQIMRPFCTEAREAITEWIREVLHTEAVLREARRAHFSCSDFLRGDAKAAAKTLWARSAECTLYGQRLLAAVWEENGWLLFRCTEAVFDAYALQLPPWDGAPEGFLEQRLWMHLKKADAPIPKAECVTDALLLALRCTEKGRWTAEAERAVLTATHSLAPKERIEAEQRMHRLARIILWERRTFLCD